jgi:hypothetical protein
VLRTVAALVTAVALAALWWEARTAYVQRHLDAALGLASRAPADGIVGTTNALLEERLSLISRSLGGSESLLQPVRPFTRITCAPSLAEMALLLRPCEAHVFQANVNDVWIRFLVLRQFGTVSVVAAAAPRHAYDEQPLDSFIELRERDEGGAATRRQAALRSRVLTADRQVPGRAWSTSTTAQVGIMVPLLGSPRLVRGFERLRESNRIVGHLLGLLASRGSTVRLNGRLFSLVSASVAAQYNGELGVVQCALQESGRPVNTLAHELVHAVIATWPLEQRLLMLLEGERYFKRHPTLEEVLGALYEGRSSLELDEEAIAFLTGSVAAGDRWVVFFHEARMPGAASRQPPILPASAYDVTREDVEMLERLNLVPTGR